VEELGAQIAHDYAGRNPLLVALLKASFVFVADLSRATRITHRLDFVERGAGAKILAARDDQNRTGSIALECRDGSADLGQHPLRQAVENCRPRQLDRADAVA